MRAARRKAMKFPNMPDPTLQVDMEPLSPPDLVAGVAECLDNYVLLTQTQEQLYTALVVKMHEFHAKSQAYNTAMNRQVPGKDTARFEELLEQMLKKRLDYAKEDEDKG